MIDHEPEAVDRMGLWEYLVVLRRRWLLVAGALVVTMAAALAYSRSATPEYVTSADVLLGPTNADATTSTGGRGDSDEVATQAHVVSSMPVARLVQKQWSSTRTPDLSRLVSVQALGTGRILRITARGSDASQAAKTVNAVASAYLQYRQQAAVDTYRQAIDRLNKRREAAKGQLSRVDALLAAGPKSGAVRTRLETQRRSLLTDLVQVDTERDALNDSLGEVTAGGELLREAGVPRRPASPRTGLNLVLGGAFGLLLGAGAALLRDRVDDGVHDEDEVRRALGDQVVLGRVPRWSQLGHRGQLVSVLQPRAPASDEYQRLGVGVRFMLAPFRMGTKTGSVVLMTSGQRSEGKTTTACNLAVAATRLGLRVVLVDADLRNAAVARLFGLKEAPGLSDLLAGADDTEPLLADAGVDGLRVLPAGTIPPNPAALLGSTRMKGVLHALAREADLVIVDSPSVLVGADTLELAHHADMVVVVTREGLSRRRHLGSVMESLRHVGAKSVGVVYNGVGDAGRHARVYSRWRRFSDRVVHPRNRASNGFPATLSSRSSASTESEPRRSLARVVALGPHPAARQPAAQMDELASLAVVFEVAEVAEGVPDLKDAVRTSSAR